ncbi:hypothetical protein [Desulfuribacillus alkaliarsenatis]|uniref:Uncharacterized protein n=1 Tax=Desulfuribacillus alkaliarsenatis TaxID=766136 RepID=A0A1E5G098_9FIRM|nr:hypothetical protein [Desulfuribacillus alkaliarsenatis]OEF96173.1 hypothetical protein BHF68_08370 [Desulfuribacillus alkaliarsenatis]
MIWILSLILLIMLVITIIYHVKGINIRIFGFELIIIFICIAMLVIFIGGVILPMPSYYIKDQSSISEEGKLSFNEILEKEIQKSGIEFDSGSFKIMDSYGMNFNHLFVGSYRVNEKEEARVFHFEKNVFGDMRPKYPFDEAPLIPIDNSYRTTIRDGIFGIYMVSVGFNSEESVLIRYLSNGLRVNETHQNKYFISVDLVSQPWKYGIITLLIIVGSNIIQDFRGRKPIQVYSKWQKGDDIFQVVKDVNGT